MLQELKKIGSRKTIENKSNNYLSNLSNPHNVIHTSPATRTTRARVY